MAVSRLSVGAARVALPAPIPILAALVAACLGLAFLPVPLAAAVVLGGAGAALVLARPEAALYLLAILVPFGSLAEFRIGGVALDPSLPLAGWLAFAVTVRAVRRHVRSAPADPPVRLGWILAGWLAFLGALALSIPDADQIMAGAKEAAKWLEFALVLIATDRLLVGRPGRGNRLLIALLLAATAEGLVGWAQFLLGIGPEGFQLGRFLRAYGTYGQPNPFAGYLNTVWPLAYVAALALTGRAVDRFRRRSPGQDPKAALLRLVGSVALAAAPVVILTAAVGMSLSRGAWLALAVAALTTNLLLGPRVRAWTVAAALIGTLIVLAGASNLLPATVSERITTAASNFTIFDAGRVTVTPENWAIVERMATWQAGWGMFRDHPILGVGAGNFDAAYGRYYLRGWQNPPGHAHNYYLNVLAEMGMIGLAGYLAFVAGCFALVVRAVRRSRSDRWMRADRASILSPRWTAIAVLGALTGLTVHNLLDNLYVHGMTIHLGLLLGLAIAAGARTTARDEARV